jgi:transposase
MRKVSVLGLDIAKNVFSAVGLDSRGQIVLRKKLRRAQVLRFFETLEPCRIAMEACGGSHFWCRELSARGHEVRLIAPQFVIPYVKSNKTDMADAEGIAEAFTRPTMRFVPLKTQFQQDIQSMHRIRERLVKNRTALANEIRGLLHEYGIVLPSGLGQLRKKVVETLELENGRKLSSILYRELMELYAELKSLDERITELEKRLCSLCKEHSSVKRLMTIPGIGFLSATALIAAVGDISTFRNSRQFAAWLGLVPRQHSTGGKPKLLGISKRGDVYLRKLLVHGARAVLYRMDTKDDRLSRWGHALSMRRGKNRAVVALANKNARIVWAVLTHETDYRCYPVAA